MKFQTQHCKQISFVCAVISCLLFFLTTHIVTRKLLFKFINSEVSSKIDSVVKVQTNLIFERMQHQENQYVLQNMFDVYKVRVKRDNVNDNLKGLCKAIRKQCSIKNLAGSPGLPGLKGQKGDKGDIGFQGVESARGETRPMGSSHL